MKLIKIYFVIILIFSCSCTANISKDELPKSTLIKVKFPIKKSNILYQFYEEFGFGETCIHTRSLFRVDSFKINNNWKKLPMLKKDINKIRLIPNKIDTLKNKEIVVKYSYKTYFDDISLISKEYIKDSSFNKKVGLLKGYYKIEDDKFLIFDDNKKIMYYEEHSCN